MRPRQTPANRDPSLPAGVRIYAIGDIHGRCDLLDSIAQKVTEDLSRAPCEAACAIFLGDYVDRGPDSFGVIARLASGHFPIDSLCLRGNHEAILLKFLEDENVLESWRRYGALETLVSYGVNVAEAMRGRGFKAAQEQLLSRLPPEHLAFLHKTRLSATIGDYFFCHAGVRPNMALDSQQEQDLLWVREEFLAFDGDHGKIIVHGHTPFPEPQVLPNRIGIDTGAYATGKLTCLVLEGTERRWIST